jgi:hypothetical protein
MKRIAAVVTSIAAFLLFVHAGSVTAPPLLQILIDVFPSATDSYQLLKRASPRTYTCSVLVLEAGTNNVLGDVKVVVGRGDRQTTKRSAGGLQTEFTVSVTAKGERADAEVVVKRGAEVLTKQLTRMSLLLPSEKIVPVK